MTVGWLSHPLIWPNDQPLAEDFRFWSDRAKTAPVEVADASAWLNRRDGPDGLALSVANGRIVLNGNIVGLRVDTADMAALAAGIEGASVIYDLEVKATDANGGVRQIRGVVELIAGLAE